MKAHSLSRRQLLRTTLAGTVLPLIAACTSAAAPVPTTQATQPPKPVAATSAPAAPNRVTVRVGIIGGTSDAGFLIADERGYFAEAGIDFQRVPFQSGPDMVQPAGSGQIEVATGAPSAGLFNAIARGIPLRVVADKGAQRPGFVFSSIVLRQDLLENGAIKSWSDLKGQKMAVAGLGNTGQVFLDKALRRGGLTWRDVEMVMLSYADMGAALANKSIYGGVAIEPFRTQWPARGLGAYLPDDAEIYLNQQAAVVMYGPQFIQNQPDAARRLMVAYLRGIRAYNDAFVKKIDRDQIIDILIKRTTLTERPLYDQIGLPALNPNGGVLTDDLVAQQEWYMEMGYQTARIDIPSAIDNQFAEFAAQQLGPYAA